MKVQKRNKEVNKKDKTHKIIQNDIISVYVSKTKTRIYCYCFEVFSTEIITIYMQFMQLFYFKVGNFFNVKSVNNLTRIKHEKSLFYIYGNINSNN